MPPKKFRLTRQKNKQSAAHIRRAETARLAREAHNAAVLAGVADLEADEAMPAPQPALLQPEVLDENVDNSEIGGVKDLGLDIVVKDEDDGEAMTLEPQVAEEKSETDESNVSVLHTHPAQQAFLPGSSVPLSSCDVEGFHSGMESLEPTTSAQKQDKPKMEDKSTFIDHLMFSKSVGVSTVHLMSKSVMVQTVHPTKTKMKNKSTSVMPYDCFHKSVGVQTSDFALTQQTSDRMTDEERYLHRLCFKLSNNISSDWNVCVREGKLLLMFLPNSSLQPSIQKSIMFFSDRIEIFAHGHSLKPNHNLFDNLDNFEGKDIQTVFSILLNLTLTVQGLNYCSACNNQVYKEMWTKGVFAERGTVEHEIKQNAPSISKYRSKQCHLLINNDQTSCLACRSEETNMKRQFNKKLKKSKFRDMSKVPLIYLEKNQLIAALKESRVLNSKYKKEIQLLKRKIDILLEKEGESIPQKWSEEFTNINKENFQKMSPIQKLFWDQQLKAASLKNKASMRWHPMIIRLALHFQMISNSAMTNIRDSGCVSFPSKRTLYDYSHAISAQEGCQSEILRDLKSQLDKCSEEYEKLVCLSFDEMHIRANLAYRKSTGELMGYVNLNEVETEFENLQAEWSGSKEATPQLARKVLAFMIQNIAPTEKNRSVKGVVALYSVTSCPASSLYTRVWDVIYHLERAGIPVLVVTCDGASTNRRFINMHPKYENKGKYVYVTFNMATSEFRVLYFIVDPPHLLKTLRNGFSNSFSHKKTRKLWKNGEYISWQLVIRCYNDHKGEKFRKALLSKATVFLTSFSRMNVGNAAKILSKTLASAVESDGKKAEEAGKPYPHYKEAVKFMRLSNDIYDCLNGHNKKSHIRFRNLNLAPYNDCQDGRFKFFDDFLHYFEEWEKDVSNRPGDFSDKERQRMMISNQTVSGWYVTLNSFRDAVKYLLQKGASDVCGRKFCQDILEQMFSTYRLKGGSSDQPDLLGVLQSRVSIHAQRQAALPSKRGNTMYEGEALEIDNTPVPKKKRSKKS